MIVHISGVQGSGKTYICEKISKNKKIVCIDTDDIMYQTFNHIENNGLPQNNRTFNKIEKRIKAEYIKQNQGKIIVFSGMTVEIPEADQKYFIKIDDLGSVFKRLMLRELEKIYQNYNQIKKVIKSSKDIENLGLEIENAAKLGVSFPTHFQEFKRDYESMTKKMIKKGYQVKTQKEIISDLLKLK